MSTERRELGIRQRGLQVSYRLAYSVGRVVLSTTRLRFSAVRVVVQRDHQVLLVRHTYSRPSVWLLPGGGLRWREVASIAAAREVEEEVGLAVSVRLLGTVDTLEDDVRARTTGFVALVQDEELKVDPVEIAEARWFPLQSLPSQISDASAALVEQASRQPGGRP